MNRREFELIADDEIFHYKKILDNCFDCKLDSFKKFCLNPIELKIDHFYTSHEKILMQYAKLNGDFSLYYSKFYESTGNDYYLFGSTNDPIFNSSNYLTSNEYITPKLITNINYHDSSKSGLVFARDTMTNEVVLLLRIDWSELSDREKDRLLFKNEKRILNTKEDKQFICFGSITHLKSKSLLKNIRGFVSNVELEFDNSLEFQNNPYVKIKTVHVPLNYKLQFKEELTADTERTIYDVVMLNQKSSKKIKLGKNSELIDDRINVFDENIKEIDKNNTEHIDQSTNSSKKIRYCMLCGREIEESYVGNKKLKELWGLNPNKCKHCVEELMMSYFKSKVNTKIFDFYLNLLKSNRVISNDFNFDFNDQFNEDVESYSNFFNEIPDELKMEI